MTSEIFSLLQTKGQLKRIRGEFYSDWEIAAISDHVLGMGGPALPQFTYTKFVVVVDSSINVRDPRQVVWVLSSQVDPQRDYSYSRILFLTHFTLQARILA